MRSNDNHPRRGFRLGSGHRGRPATASRLARILALLSAVAISGGLMVAVAGTASADSDGKVTICHATEANENANNPYTKNKISVSSVDADGHSGHTGPVWTPELQASHDADSSNTAYNWGDIIPPTDGFPSGLNWWIDGNESLGRDQQGKAIYENNCNVPADPGGDTPDPTTVTVQKQWVVDGGPATADSSDDGMTPGSLTVATVNDADWNESFEWAGTTWPTVTEGSDSTVPSGCAVTGAVIKNGTDSLAAGKNNVITVTNSVSCTTLTLKKVIVGEGSIDAWTLTAAQSGSTGISGKTGDSTVTNVRVSAGSYGLSESGPSGFERTGLACTADNHDGAALSVSSDIVAIQQGQHVTCTFTNTRIADGNNPGGPGGNPEPPTPPVTPPPGSNTPAPPNNTPQVITVLPQNSVEPAKPPIKVLGESQEVAPAPVIKVKPASQVAAAPSANAHTGQGQSPWVYLLFGAGALLMLGAWRVRRNGNV